MFEPLIYFGISLLFAGLIVWAVMPLVHRRAARSFEARQQAALRSPDHLSIDIAPSPKQDEIVEQLKDKVASQSTELDNNAKTITQLNVDRDLLKVEIDALRIQRVETSRQRDTINRLEAERDKLKSEVVALQAQRAEWDKSNTAIKRLEIERDGLKSQIDALKGHVRATQKTATSIKPAPAKSPAVGSGPTFLPLDDTQRAQFPATDTNEKDTDPQQDKKDHRAAS